jgi:hypothetical protein
LKARTDVVSGWSQRSNAPVGATMIGPTLPTGFCGCPMPALRQKRARPASFRLLPCNEAQAGKEHNAIAATVEDMWSSGAGPPV